MSEALVGELLGAAHGLERINFNETAALLRRAAEEIARQRRLLSIRAEAPEPDEATAKEWASRLGRLGGKKGGVPRARNLSPSRRSEIAKAAAEARWGAPTPKAKPPTMASIERMVFGPQPAGIKPRLVPVSRAELDAIARAQAPKPTHPF